jgi:MEDS: MEthanogen/methylotroph, DcmR Sensory domain
MVAIALDAAEHQISGDLPGGGIMGRLNHPVTLAGSAVKRRCHACAFFHDREEEYRLLLPFAQEGFAQHDKIFHIIDGRHKDERLRRIGALGIDVAMAEESGQLEVRPWENAYLRQGRFDQYAMLALVEEVLGQGKEKFGSRACGRTWNGRSRTYRASMTSWNTRAA